MGRSVFEIANSSAREWGMTPDEVNHSQAGNVFMLGAGGIFSENFPPPKSP